MTSIHRFMITILLVPVCFGAQAQSQSSDSRQELQTEPRQMRVGRETTIPIEQASEDRAPQIDGRLDESVWQGKRIEGVTMGVVDPETLDGVPYDTDVSVFYTSEGLYMGIDMEQPADTLVRRISGRDAREISRDRVSVTLDSSGTGRFGYWMSLALGDNQMDGTIRPERQYGSDWDGAWYGATAETERGWSAEFHIPWGQLAMPDSEGQDRHIGFYTERVVAHLDQNWAWPAITGSDPVFLSDFPRLEMTEVEPTQQWSLFPYASTTYDEVDGTMEYKTGADVFWRPSSNFQLTGTLNPDFGSAESDNVVVNLTANETFFPEKRLFFQEGQEIFQTTPRSTGSNGKRFTILNTRRIGGRPPAPDLPEGQSLSKRQRIRPADLTGALKATGQNGPIRYGVLSAMEDETDYWVGDSRVTQQGRDFGAVRLLYEDSRGATYRGLGYMGTRVRHPDSDAQVHAIDYHFLDSSGEWNVDGQLVTSDVADTGTGYATFADIVYQPRQGLRHELQLTYLDDKIDVNDFGFLSRNNSREAWYRFEWIKTDLDIVRNFRLGSFIRYEENLDGDRVNNAIPVFNLNVTLNNLDQLSMGVFHFPSRYDDLNSFGNGTFNVSERTNFNAEYTTDPSRPVSYSFGGGMSGEFAGGSSYNLSTGINWRPMDNINVGADIEYEDRDGWLLHQEDQFFTTFESRQWRTDFSLDYFLTAKQQLSATLQWVGIRAKEDRFLYLFADRRELVGMAEKPPGPPDDFSVSQLNFQLRYRWQIAPLSDLFVVYTKNDDQQGRLTDFNDQFSNGWQDPLVNQLVVKLRYRFGT